MIARFFYDLVIKISISQDLVSQRNILNRCRRRLKLLKGQYEDDQELEQEHK